MCGTDNGVPQLSQNSQSPLTTARDMLASDCIKSCLNCKPQKNVSSVPSYLQTQCKKRWGGTIVPNHAYTVKSNKGN